MKQCYEHYNDDSDDFFDKCFQQDPFLSWIVTIFIFVMTCLVML